MAKPSRRRLSAKSNPGFVDFTQDRLCFKSPRSACVKTLPSHAFNQFLSASQLIVPGNEQLGPASLSSPVAVPRRSRGITISPEATSDTPLVSAATATTPCGTGRNGEASEPAPSPSEQDDSEEQRKSSRNPTCHRVADLNSGVVNSAACLSGTMVVAVSTAMGIFII
jgi:hypothetical protein